MVVILYNSEICLTSNPLLGSQPIWPTCLNPDGVLISSLVSFFGFPFFLAFDFPEEKVTGAGAKKNIENTVSVAM